MNIIRGRRAHAEAERADDLGAGNVGRRNVLGGLAALPVVYSIGSATPALAAATAARPGSAANAPQAATDLVHGPERRYNTPLLAPGTRLVLPAGINAVPILDYYRHPYPASAQSAWPNLTATDGTTVDASIVPGRGAPTRIAVLGTFTEGWYELIHAGGRNDRVTWDAREFPFLLFYGEFGATNEAPYQDRFYTLSLQAFSRNPYSGNTPAR